MPMSTVAELLQQHDTQIVESFDRKQRKDDVATHLVTFTGTECDGWPRSFRSSLQNSAGNHGTGIVAKRAVSAHGRFCHRHRMVTRADRPLRPLYGADQSEASGFVE